MKRIALLTAVALGAPVTADAAEAADSTMVPEPPRPRPTMHAPT